MLLKLLPKQEKSNFLLIAELLTICDKPIYLNGKELLIIAPKVNFILVDKQFLDEFLIDIKSITIQKNKKEGQLIADLKNEGDDFIHSECGILETKLIEKIATYPLHSIPEPETRLMAALAVLKSLLTEKKSEFPSVPKLMIFELMQVALFDGNISNIKSKLLNEFKNHYKLEDYVFDELLEQAKVTSREINKTITIIFE